MLVVQLYRDSISLLKGTTLGFDLLGGVNAEQAKKLAEMLNEHVLERKRLTNTPVRQARSVLKCPDDRKNRVVSAQATYPCGSSAVGGRVCEQRHAAERVLPESRFELQHAGSPSERNGVGREGVSQFPRPVVWCRWSWRPGNRRQQHEPSCGLAVVLPGGRRIEVHPDFDTNTFERLVSVLERV